MRELLFVVLLGMSLPGCGRRSGPVVAVVNGVQLTAAELAKLLPQQVDSSRLDEVRREVVEDWVNRELFVQEAERTGLDSLVSYQLEREQQGLVIQELMRRITEETQPVT
ncbi:MAG: hypothetical protein ABIK37_00890, partial [candidate division WOR-3 bacterium]